MEVRMGATLLAFALALACSDSSKQLEGLPDHVVKRHVDLEGAANFRDLGGYATQDGREVKWGLFYRSDNLHSLTDRDLDRVSGLDIRLVCDFRSPEEKAEEPKAEEPKAEKLSDGSQGAVGAQPQRTPQRE